MPEVNESLVIPTHDAILPYMFEGVKWAIPNVGDNKETHNMAIARLFEKIGEPSYRARQVLKWLHQSGHTDFSYMTNLGLKLRKLLEQLLVSE